MGRVKRSDLSGRNLMSGAIGCIAGGRRYTGALRPSRFSRGREQKEQEHQPKFTLRTKAHRSSRNKTRFRFNGAKLLCVATAQCAPFLDQPTHEEKLDSS